MRAGILRDQFSDFCEGAQAIVATAASADDLYYDDIAEIKMDEWYRGRVALIGDAQHAVSPVTGMGASMAMEDASVLVQELRRSDGIDSALSRFAARRDRRIRNFRKLVNRADGWMMASGTFGFLRDRFLRFVPDWYFTRFIDTFMREEV